MKKMIITRGFPASGKTTFALEWVAEAPGTRININRDDIRKSLGMPPVGTKDQENTVTKIAHAQIQAAFNSGLDLIVSDTNLPSRRVKDLAMMGLKKNYEITVKDFIVDFDELFRRDANRTDSVGDDVIKKMASRFPYQGWRKGEDLVKEARIKMNESINESEPYPNDPEFGKPGAILVDLDGTLADMNGRDPYDTGERILLDRVNSVVNDVVTWSRKDGLRIIIMSGRKNSGRGFTETWLSNHGIQFDELHMRADNDNRPDWIVKDELVRKYVAPNYYVHFCLDDRNQVVDHHRACGYTVLQVAPGDF